jgi:tRNA(Arg) A34 adenosine deaminase TadA
VATDRRRDRPHRSSSVSLTARPGSLPSIRVRSHTDLLIQAIGLARDARDHGNHPFGALLTDRDGRILLRAENTVMTDSDVTCHAETNLVRAASRAYTTAELADTILYTSTEPCAMCAGAIYWAGVGTVVYALPETALHALAGDDPDNLTLEIPCRTVFAAGRRDITVLGPFDLPQARDVHVGFWRPMGSA